MSTADLQNARDAVLRAHEQQPDALVVLVGPTASGKTELALAVAAETGAEIVNADSIQIVRHFDLGSGKPSAGERAVAPHHLFDALEPHDAIDAAGYARLADAVIADVRARGKLPLVVGGTFFWVRALLLGLAPLPSADPALRAAHAELVRATGSDALHAQLALVDPESARRLHPNDVLRVSRALEVHTLTGRPQSELHAEHGFRTRRHESLLFGRHAEPALLDPRIEARARHWLAAGWRAEVETLLGAGYGDARAMGSVGYKEVRAHLDGALAETELLPAIVRATRVFARRQRTWLKGADVRWL